jgi:hypothetical protein
VLTEILSDPAQASKIHSVITALTTRDSDFRHLPNIAA